MSVGSTAGWEAAALGVPIVHVDLAGAASNNPMFVEPALCRTVRDAEELIEALHDIENLGADEFKAEAGCARRYFEDCFSMKTDGGFKGIVTLLQGRKES